MNFFSKKKIVVTHSGVYHADDVFAVATISLLHDGKITTLRTRETSLFSKGDYVIDVSGIYDPSRNYFDHHQEGGAGVRDNGVPYASFGLVWKSFGERVSGSAEIANRIDAEMVQAIDANDTGLDLYELKKDVPPYLIQDAFAAFRPTWKEESNFDPSFLAVVSFAGRIIQREVVHARDFLLAVAGVQKAYEEAPDKRLIILEHNYPFEDILVRYPEPLFVVYPKAHAWQVQCVPKQLHTFKNRKSLPFAWASKRDEELIRITGVSDAVFCHTSLFLAVAKSKDGALQLARQALL